MIPPREWGWQWVGLVVVLMDSSLHEFINLIMSWVQVLDALQEYITFFIFYKKKSVGQLASNPSSIAIRGRLGRR